MRKVWLFLKWCFVPHREVYVEGATSPDFTLWSAGVDGAARAVSRGRVGYGGIRLKRQKCDVCGAVFQCSRKRHICRRLKCYLAYHGGM